MTMTLALAILLTAAGVFTVRLAWHCGRQQQGQRQRILRGAGWILLAVALVPWMRVGGQDRGVALAIGIVMLLGLALALFEGWRALRAPKRCRREREARNDLPEAASTGPALVLRRAWIFCLGGPLALAAALALGLALWLGLESLGAAPSNVLAIAMLAVPVAWAILSVFATMEGRLRSRTLIVALPGLLGLAASLLLAGAAS